MTADRRAGLFLVIAGTAGLAASFTLTVERFRLLVDPAYVPSCSINPVLSCGSVMATAQASVFGFPNPLLGLIGFTVVGISGLLVMASVRLPRWYRVGLAAASSLAVVLIHWLIFQSLYRIGALCPYCIVVWAVTIPTFVVTLRLAVTSRLLEWRWILVAAWFAVLVVLIYLRFDYYWNTLV